MNFTTYILFSKSINKYYTGYTSLPPIERLRRHNANHKGFTGRAQDWNLIYQIAFEHKQEALDLEKKIKKRGAFRFLADKNLI